MPEEKNITTTFNETKVYQIRLTGHLGPEWSDWFDGMSIELAVNGDSLISGEIVDQAELHGLLRKVRDLGLALVSVTRIGSEQHLRASNN